MVESILLFNQYPGIAPGNTDIKLVICKNKKGELSWNRAYYDGKSWHGSGSVSRSRVVAWATINKGDINWIGEVYDRTHCVDRRLKEGADNGTD